jgi:hypothetical protein
MPFKEPPALAGLGSEAPRRVSAERKSRRAVLPCFFTANIRKQEHSAGVLTERPAGFCVR